MSQKFQVDFGGKLLKIETGLAPQANASLQISYGETVILVTAVMSKNLREGANFFPLFVDYEERLYAAGRIKGSRFIKREGRPTDEAIVTGRLIDRVIRPRFDYKMRNEVQVVATVLSVDGDNDADIPAVIGASLTLGLSDIPWGGPLSIVRVGGKAGNFIINPSYKEREEGNLDLVIAGDGEVINMIEFEGKEIPNDQLMEAIKFGKEEIKKNIEFQKKTILEYGLEKKEIKPVALEDALAKKAKKFLEKELPQALLSGKKKTELNHKLDNLRDAFFEHFEEEINKAKNSSFVKDAFSVFFEEEVNEILHQNILEKDERPDGRKLDEVRPITAAVGILPITHGSGLFSRGLTRALSVLTLAGPDEEQILEGMEIVGKKRFIHHYNFPPYSVGEVGGFRGPGRREIGHSSLAEKALWPLIPSKEEFPYTLRIVTEILSSNGSSSMASVCGGTLALLDAGVPIKGLAAGIAMGLILGKKGKYKILTDIQGPEDYHGDMDLKAAGTKKGLTAIQLDVKINGISDEILERVLIQAEKARIQILEKIEQVIPRPRTSLSPRAPRVLGLKINPEKIREVIGSGGRIINGIIDETGAAIDIEDDGQVYITGKDETAVNQALQKIKDIIKDYEPGEEFEGVISRILDFGAFAKINSSQEGLIHISKLAPYRVESVKDIVQEGDRVKVELLNVDDLGRLNFKLVKNFDERAGANNNKKNFQQSFSKGNKYDKRQLGEKPTKRRFAY